MEPGIEKQVLQFWFDQLTRIKLDEVTTVQIAREMVQFLNLSFGSSAWLTLVRLKASRQLNKERGVSIENDLDLMHNDPNKRPKLAEKLFWLNLSNDELAYGSGKNDMTVVGPAAPTQLEMVLKRKQYLPDKVIMT